MKKVVRITLLVLASLILLGTIIFVIFISSIMNQTKSVEFDKDIIISATKQINIYSDTNELINTADYAGKNVVAISDINPTTIECFVSIEDKEFYKHNGLNYKRIAKALYNNLKSGSFKEGASTISQQLIKNTHLTNEKTLTRKAKEMILTKKLEKSFTKDEIMETYLNVIYFGNGCYGIENASNFYFSKPASELKLEESALLAGMIKAPAHYCPITNYDNALKRRNLVMKEMMEDGKISDEEYYNASQKPIMLSITKNSNIQEDEYIKAVKDEAEKLLGINSQQITLRGYKIYTYFNEDSQNALKESLNNNANYHKNSYGNEADSLGVIINNKNGGIEAFYGKSEYDLVNIKRQPGSAIKSALVYAPALDCGKIHACSEILDEKIDYNGYSPNNVGNTFSGYVNVRDCVAKSLNIPAVKIMKDVGIEKCKQFASNCGIEFSKHDNGYALALGGFNEGITLQALVGSYIPFANSGKYIQPKFIKKITTSDDVVIYNRNEQFNEVMGDDTAYLMTNMLIEGVQSGTSRRLKDLPYQVAGKTGTVAVKNTNLNTDVYSVAYTTEHCVGVWLGNYSLSNEHNLEGSNNGGTYCTSMVKDTLNGLYAHHSPSDFIMPESVVTLRIDEKNLSENHTVKLAGENCPDRYIVNEIFSSRHAPKQVSDIYSNFDIDFSVELNDNIATIFIDAKDYLIYDVYVDNMLIKSIDNKKGEFSFTYDKLLPNKMYTFYCDARTNYSDEVVKSKEVSIYTKNLYENLLQDKPIEKNTNSNLSWYFY